ncbi:actin-binding Rho-activating protein [Engraulis encrasicolus]|uniref:actin-binding Rho-activating protein n=1 Tax=Engraulis encrasicolus TaxID=184585 RepID=UPI002FD6184D
MATTTTTSSAAQETKSFTRVVRKIKCAAMVNSLAKSWQSWASENTSKQDTIPSGWTPDSVLEMEAADKKNGEQHDGGGNSEVKLPVPRPRVVTVDAGIGSEDQGETVSAIKTSATVTKMAPKISECGSDWVSAVKEKMAAPAPANEDAKNFLGNASPTRRRYCASKAIATGTAARGTTSTSGLGSRSSSLDTEDSGLGEEMGLSDQSDQNDTEQKKKPATRPKIKVTTMGDIKSRWQQWSESHLENQKLNPFSEDFDYEYAMSSRLQKGDSGYGRPKEGSKTAQRGDRANKHIHKEMDEMCYIIRDMGAVDKQGRIYITFGRLFDRYVKISDKVVGILLRCRKHKMLDFEGEMLWKGQDDHVIITMRD